MDTLTKTLVKRIEMLEIMEKYGEEQIASKNETIEKLQKDNIHLLDLLENYKNSELYEI